MTIYSIYLSYDRYIYLSYDKVCHMTGIYQVYTKNDIWYIRYIPVI